MLTVEGFDHISIAVDKAQEKIKDIKSGVGKPLMTFSKNLNDKIEGLYDGDQVVIAARTGVGKSAYANVLIKSLFELNPDRKLICLYWTFEMTAWRQVIRLYSNVAQMAVKDILSSNNPISQEAVERLREIGETLKNHNIYFRGATVDPKKWSAMIRKVQKDNPEYTIVNVLDHTRLISKSGEKNEEALISNLMLEGVEVKNEIGCINIFLSQMNRKIEDSSDNPGQRDLMISDIFGADSVAQCADLVFALHRPEQYNITTYKKLPAENLIAHFVLKQRDGWTGMIGMTHNLKYNTITDFIRK